MNKDLFMGFYLVSAAIVTLACTILLAMTLHGLMAMFTGICTIAFAVFSAYAFNVYRSKHTNMF